jgi:hypothetical protein
MPGLYTGATGLWGGFAGLLYGSTSLSTPPGLLADAAGFSPASLFAAGEQGVWYDPSDFSTMFQGNGGTTPVTAVEQPVGLLLDKSKQQSWFDVTGAVWTKTAGDGVVTVSGNTITITGATTATQVTRTAGSIPLTAGQARMMIQADWVTATGVLIWLRGVPAAPANGVQTLRTAALNNSTLERLDVATGSVTFTISYFQYWAGNHATHSTTASRPVLSARVNLLTYSEDQSNGAWVNYNATQQSNVGVAPDGTNTADRIVEAAGASIQARYQQITGGLNIPYTVSVYAKADQRNVFSMSYCGTGPNNWFAATFELTGSGTVTKTGAGASGTYTNSSIISVGNGWYFCQITGSTGQASTHYVYPGPSNTNNPTYGTYGTLTYSGSTSNGVLVWGFDLRPTDQTTLLPAYQRIAAATDYDTTGFPYYLRFDGTDDSMATGTINFSATDKMSVFAGVRKLAVSFGSFATLGALNAAGQFDMAGVTSAGVGYYASSLRGNSGTEAGTRVAPYLDPITNVVQTSFDIAGATRTNEISIRVNGIVPANQSENPGAPGPAGGGNFGNYPLYIGSRGGSSLRFNGNIYSLIVLGRTATAAEITNTETYVNSKTLAY